MRYAMLLSVLVGCQAAEKDDGLGETGADSSTPGDTGASASGIAALFDPAVFAEDVQIVSCTLDNGDTTDCYQLSFANYLDSSGPFCPATVDDIGGVGIYDGATNPGFQVLKRSLWESMEQDGFDILDEAGNVNINGGPGEGTCLEMGLDALVVSFLIPVTPVMLSSPNVIDIVELYGLALDDGMPLTGHPPSVVDGPPMPNAAGGGIPSLDPCGGHADPAGYWHWHFTPNSTQSVLDAFGISEVACTDVPQRMEGLVGFAKDGFPIYAPLEGGVVPSGLDACNGVFGVTPEFPEGVYHYYALNEAAPNLPTCIMGASVRNPMSVK